MTSGLLRCAVAWAVWALGLSGGAVAFAQASAVAPHWELEKNLAALVKSFEPLRPVLVQIEPEKWQAEGASESYAAQKKSLLAEIDGLSGYTSSLAKRPENLPLALEILYRTQSIEARVHTLAEGLRKYQNPAISHLILSMVAATHGERDRLFEYSLDFAKQRETEYKVVDEEAQRCRAALSKQPR